MSRPLTRLGHIRTRLLAQPLITSNEIEVIAVRFEEYDSHLETTKAKQIDGAAIIGMYTGQRNPSPEILDECHTAPAYQIEIWKDPRKHDPESDATFDQLEEEIIAALHGWAAPDVPAAQAHLQRLRFSEADFLGEVLNEEGDVEFLRYGINFVTRAVVPTVT